MSGIQDSPRAFAVLAIDPPGDAPVADRIKALCADIPGVGALRVDTERGRIHIFYDGTPATMGKIEAAVQIPGHRVRLFGDRPALLPRTLATGPAPSISTDGGQLPAELEGHSQLPPECYCG